MSTGTVSLNQNIVDGSGMQGGYASWQLIPNGTSVSPVKGKSAPYTITKATQLYFSSSTGSWDLYLPTNIVDQDFPAGEVITMTGPIPQPDKTKVVNFQGSSKLVVWKFEKSGP